MSIAAEYNPSMLERQSAIMLFTSIEQGCFGLLTRALPGVPDIKGCGKLYDAITKRSYQEVLQALEDGQNPNGYVLFNQCMPLPYAHAVYHAFKDATQASRFPLAQRLDICKELALRGAMDYPPLTYAFLTESVDSDVDCTIVKALINHPSINLNAYDIYGRNIAHHAAIRGNEKVIVLLDEKACAQQWQAVDFGLKDFEGKTPADLACEHNHFYLQTKLEKFANRPQKSYMDVKRGKNGDLLTSAMDTLRSSMLVFNSAASMCGFGKRVSSPPPWCLETGENGKPASSEDVKSTSLLSPIAIDVSYEYSPQHSPYHKQRDDLKILFSVLTTQGCQQVKAVLDRLQGFDLNGCVAMYQAIEAGELERVSTLLNDDDSSACNGHLNEFGHTIGGCLHFVKKQAVKDLFAQREHLYFCSPFLYALKKVGHSAAQNQAVLLEIIEKMLGQFSLRLDARDEQSKTALHIAVEMGRADLTTRIVAAAMKKYKGIHLIEYVNALDKAQKTALDYAFEKKDYDSAHQLISAGAYHKCKESDCLCLLDANIKCLVDTIEGWYLLFTQS
ncbi:MAG: hypothetical protein H6679_05810 [Epsilonproteobacteria bacterium]|nr:hypothetical protein [Campylobacterota bacterium]